MVPGDIITVYVRRQTVAEIPALGLTATTDWSIVQNGAAAAPSSASYIGTVRNWAYYSLVCTLTSTSAPLLFIVEPAAGDDIVTAAGDDLTTYDTDALADLLTASIGSAAASGITVSTDFGTVKEGDAWSTGTLTVPTSVISRFGYSDLTGMTISAGLKNTPSDSPVTIAAGTPGAAILSAANRTCQVTWDTFPVGLSPGTAQSKTFQMDIQLKHTVSGRIITAFTGNLVVVWQSDTTA